MTGRPERGAARQRILDAATGAFRERGFKGTTVDEVCELAGVTKGAFFHHFASKEELAIATAHAWTRSTSEIFSAADYHALEDPIERVLGYVDMRLAILEGSPAQCSCVAGTMLQEIFRTHPTIREACAESIFSHADSLVPDLEAALKAAGSPPGVTAPSLARHTQVVIQGALVLSKAADDLEVAREALHHLRRYVEAILHHEEPE